MTKQGLLNEDGSLVKTQFMKMISNGDEAVDKIVSLGELKFC